MLADLVRAGFDNVDLVFLDADDTVLKYYAIRDNWLWGREGDAKWNE